MGLSLPKARIDIPRKGRLVAVLATQDLLPSGYMQQAAEQPKLIHRLVIAITATAIILFMLIG